MANLNEARIIGNLGQEPELKYTQTGRPVCTLNIATNRVWTDDATKKEQSEVSWHRVVVWGKQAENAAKYLAKGDPVFVGGRMHTRSYEDSEGKMRWVTEVIAQSVQFLKPAPKNRPPHPGDDSSPRTSVRDASSPGASGSFEYIPSNPGDDDIPF